MRSRGWRGCPTSACIRSFPASGASGALGGEVAGEADSAVLEMLMICQVRPIEMPRRSPRSATEIPGAALKT